MSEPINAQMGHNLYSAFSARPERAPPPDVPEALPEIPGIKFGPAFENKCLRRDAIICTDPRCQRIGRCRMGVS